MKDACVLCGRETEYDRETPVHLRKYYVDGAGQLCDDCGGKQGADSPKAVTPEAVTPPPTPRLS